MAIAGTSTLQNIPIDTSDTEGGPGTFLWKESTTETEEEGDGDADGRLDMWRSCGITGLTPALCSLLQMGLKSI